MRILTWLFTGLLFTLELNAQLDHFVYLQSDNLQPFYVKMSNKIMSSSTSGYLILSKLKDGNINLVIGSPKNEFSEQKFSITISNDDKGYEFKNSGDKGWALFDLQNASAIYAKNDPVIVPQKQPENGNDVAADSKPDAFTDMLATVSQDSTVKTISIYRPQPPKVEMKPDSSALTKTIVADQSQKNTAIKTQLPPNNAKKDSATTQGGETRSASIPPQKETVVAPPVAVTPNTSSSGEVYTKSIITLISNKEQGDSRELVFLDQQKGSGTDTISIFIDKPAKSLAAVVQTNPMDSVRFENRPAKEDTPKVKTDAPIVSVQAENKKEPVLIQNNEPAKDSATSTPVAQDKGVPVVRKDTSSSARATEATIEVKPVPDTAAEAAKAPLLNSDCREVANEADFIELRRTMILENNDDDMIYVARKVFKTKCFKAGQVRNLAYLFLTDQGKYKFLDAAFPYVYDPEEFKKLGKLLKDEYFINRFNAMIGQ